MTLKSGDMPKVAEWTSPSAYAFVQDKLSANAKELIEKLCKFVEEDCMPMEELYHRQIPKDPEQRWKVIPEALLTLQKKAQDMGLWNLFLPKTYPESPGLTNLEYSIMAEIMGRSMPIAPMATNCNAPDTGNMEVLAKYGTREQKDKWLGPLMEGKIRSSFAMTEPAVASSDATNIQTRITIEGDEAVINGHKWWISGAGDPRTKLHIVMGKTDPDNKNRHRQQSIVLVPADTPGVKVVRPMQVFGYDDAPEGHMEVIYENVRVPKTDIVLGPGRGFEIIQGRLGPGRIHHCMRSIGVAQRALDMMLTRVTDPSRKTFGKKLYEHSTVIAFIAQARMEIEQARLLVLSAAHMIDNGNAKMAMKDIAIAKVVVPSMTLRVLDRAMQLYGAMGACQDTVLAPMYAGVRTLRWADGPDEVHTLQIGILELKRAAQLHAEFGAIREKSDSHCQKAGLTGKL